MSMTGNAVLDSAAKRAILLAVLAGASAFIGARQQGLDWESAVYVALGALIPILIARLGLEGGWDSHRASTGNINAGDVPSASPKVEVIPVGEVGAVTMTGSVTATEGAG